MLVLARFFFSIILCHFVSDMCLENKMSDTNNKYSSAKRYLLLLLIYLNLFLPFCFMFHIYGTLFFLLIFNISVFYWPDYIFFVPFTSLYVLQSISTIMFCFKMLIHMQDRNF